MQKLLRSKFIQDGPELDSNYIMDLERYNSLAEYVLFTNDHFSYVLQCRDSFVRIVSNLLQVLQIFRDGPLAHRSTRCGNDGNSRCYTRFL